MADFSLLNDGKKHVCGSTSAWNNQAFYKLFGDIEHIQRKAIELHRRDLPSIDYYQELLEADYKRMYGETGEKQTENTHGLGKWVGLRFKTQLCVIYIV